MHGRSMFARSPGGEFPSDYVPLLRWLIFTGVTLFGFVLAWHFGLVRLMLASDTTHISTVICALYLAVSLHCLAQTIVVMDRGDIVLAGRREELNAEDVRRRLSV